MKGYAALVPFRVFGSAARSLGLLDPALVLSWN
jgi:hypothetical protein